MVRRPPGAFRVPQGFAGCAAVFGGLGWLLLAPAAELVRRDLLSYDGYSRLLAVPLLLFNVALALASRRSVWGKDRGVRAGLLVASVGSGLLLVGNVVEFYGVLLQDDLNAQAAYQAGRPEHWLGSDIGWLIFGAGMLVLLVGGLMTALALRRRRTDATWLPLFAASLGSAFSPAISSAWRQRS
jgi:hypothetical protein